MIVPEDRAKILMAGYGLTTPPGAAAKTADEAAAIARQLDGSGVVKALIPTGARGKAGGVKACSGVEEAHQAAGSLLGAELLGHRVEMVLVEQLMPVKQEIYVGVLANTATNLNEIIVDFSGGVEIENKSAGNRGSMLRMEIDPGDLLPLHRMRKYLHRSITAEPGLDLDILAQVLVTLYRAAVDLDALLLEINPLAVLEDGSIALLDCKLEVDDNSLVRQPILLEIHLASLNERERRAREIGVSYVPLDGDIGVITSGAGLGMATLDMLTQADLKPADFLDTGGGISKKLVKGALELIMEEPEVKGVIVNLYGGINRMLEAAEGITAALENVDGDRPVVVKILGNQQEEAWAKLEPEPNVHVIRLVQTEAAVTKLAELLR